MTNSPADGTRLFAREHPLRRWLPWIIGVSVVALLLSRISLPELSAAIRRGPYLALIAFTVLHFGASFVTDVAAARVALAAAGVRRPFLEVFWMRGATYLAGLLNFTLGQGAIAFHLLRTGVRGATAAGVTTLLVFYNFAALAALSLLGTLTLASLGSRQKLLLAAAAVVPLALSIGLHLANPTWLARWEFTKPIFATHLRSHAFAFSVRVAHFTFLTALHWIAMRIWGIPLPLSIAMALIPLLLFVAALPLTPNGIGTVQVTQLALFSSYVPAATADAREATILAFSLTQFATAFVLQAALGYFCFLRWRRDLGQPRSPHGGSLD